MSQSIDLTGTSTLPIIINDKSSFVLALKKYDYKNGPVSNWPTGLWRMSIQDADGAIVLTLTEGNGLQIAGNVLTISRNTIQATLGNGKYKYDIRCDLADGSNIYPFEGDLTIKTRITERL